MTGPSRVIFTRHAEQKARRLGITASDLAEAVLANHIRRRRNPAAADWQVVAGGQVVVYNWPDGDDATRARVVSFWPER